LGFIGCEAVDVDAEDFDDFIGEPSFSVFAELGGVIFFHQYGLPS
jgi:hypothetical protein